MASPPMIKPAIRAKRRDFGLYPNEKVMLRRIWDTKSNLRKKMTYIELVQLYKNSKKAFDEASSDVQLMDFESKIDSTLGYHENKAQIAAELPKTAREIKEMDRESQKSTILQGLKARGARSEDVSFSEIEASAEQAGIPKERTEALLLELLEEQQIYEPRPGAVRLI